MSDEPKLPPRISVKAAAALIGCTTGRVRQLIGSDGNGTIKARKAISGGAWEVLTSSAQAYADKDRGAGRPRVADKSTEAGATAPA